jgi:hypothetical protein
MELIDPLSMEEVHLAIRNKLERWRDFRIGSPNSMASVSSSALRPE